MSKGIFTTETLGVIIAVIALVGLGFLGVKLYNIWVDQDLKNAKAFIEDISTKIETLNDGENNTFLMRGIKGWVLVGYDFSDASRPDKCFLNSCLCLCENDVASCQDSGYCRTVDRNVSVMSSGAINLELIFEDVNPGYYANISASCYSSFNPLDPISVNKDKEEIKITVNYGLIDEDEKYGILISRLESCSNYVSAVDNAQRDSFKISKG